MRIWRESRAGRFRASEADFGPYLLAAYGMGRRYCWEVALGGRGGPIHAEGTATSLATAMAAAEAAALDQLAAAQPRPARSLPPAPLTWH